MAYIKVNGDMRPTRSREALEIAEQTVDRLHQLLPEDIGVPGGVLYMTFRGTPPSVHTVHSPVGRILNLEQWQLFNRLAPEKPLRAAMHLHWSSWQSRNDAREHYAGGVVGTHLLCGFSGIRQLGDEAVSLEVLVGLEDLTREEADAIAQISDNKYYRALRAAS